VPVFRKLEKMIKKLMLGTAMAVVLGSAAFAQELFRSEAGPVAILPSEFIGKRVFAVENLTDTNEYAGVQADRNDIGKSTMPSSRVKARLTPCLWISAVSWAWANVRSRLAWKTSALLLIVALQTS